MELPVILARIAGIILLGWTARSIYKHIREKIEKRRHKHEDQQSMSERFLNNLLLYLWLAFMTAFSIGMIVNN